MSLAPVLERAQRLRRPQAPARDLRARLHADEHLASLVGEPDRRAARELETNTRK